MNLRSETESAVRSAIIVSLLLTLASAHAAFAICHEAAVQRLLNGDTSEQERTAAAALLLELIRNYDDEHKANTSLIEQLKNTERSLAAARYEQTTLARELEQTRQDLINQIEANLRNDGTPEVYGPVMNRQKIPELFALASQGLSATLNVGMLSLDIDKFGSINTSFGHQGGDEILKRFIAIVEQVLDENTRSSQNQKRTPTFERRVADDHIEQDYFIRVGGEEFLIYLPELSQTRTIEIAEAIRMRFEKDHMIFSALDRATDAEPDKAYPIDKTNMTVSIGVTNAEIKPNSTAADLKSVLVAAASRADKALYLAKELHTREHASLEARQQTPQLWDTLDQPIPVPLGRNRVAVMISDNDEPKPVLRTNDFFIQTSR